VRSPPLIRSTSFFFWPNFPLREDAIGRRSPQRLVSVGPRKEGKTFRHPSAEAREQPRLLNGFRARFNLMPLRGASDHGELTLASLLVARDRVSARPSSRRCPFDESDRLELPLPWPGFVLPCEHPTPPPNLRTTSFQGVCSSSYSLSAHQYTSRAHASEASPWKRV